MSIFYNYLKLFLRSKWKFFPPPKKKILIFDPVINPFKKYFNFEDYNTLYRRGEEINLFIILVCFFQLKINSKNYYKNYIKFSKPKVIITAIDNLPSFYLLHKLTNVKTVFVQNGIRTMWGDIFSMKNITKKKKISSFIVDYMFVFNEHIAKKYKSFIVGKTVSIGSFRNNISKISKKRKKKEILWLSGYKPYDLNDKITGKFANNYFYKNDDVAIRLVYNLTKENNIKFNILGRCREEHRIQEENYFKKNCNKKINYIKYFLERDTYKIIDQYEYIMCIDSTLGKENLSRNGKSGFFFNRPYKYPISTRRYGGMEKTKRKGPYWTTYNNRKEFKRVFDFVIKSNDKTWNKARSKYNNNVITYDEGNQKFLNIMSKILKAD